MIILKHVGFNFHRMNCKKIMILMNLPVLPMVCLVGRYFRYHCLNLNKKKEYYIQGFVQIYKLNTLQYILSPLSFYSCHFPMVDNRECRPNIIFYRFFTSLLQSFPVENIITQIKRLELFFLYFHKMKFITFIFKNILFQRFLHSNRIYCKTQ